MRLFFDGRFINPSKPDGISSFSIGLIRELDKKSDLTVLIDSDAQSALIPGLNTRKVNKPTSIKEVFLALKLRKQNIDVLVSPMQTTSALGRNFKLVLTLHDLIYYRHRTPPSDFAWPIRLGWWIFHLSYFPQRLLLNNADLVLTVSETTKNQMISKRLTKRPIQVIHNASDEPSDIRRTNGSESKDLIYMGSFIGYKDVEFLIKAMGSLKDHRLVLLSRITPSRKAELESLAREYGSDVLFVGGVTDSEYTLWLSKAKALVSASKDEGFGIPVVEAMRHGTPVILNDLEIFREVAGSAGLYFESGNTSSFASMVAQLSDTHTWSEYSDRARLQAKDFSWEQSAAKLLDLCKGLGSPTL